MLYFKDDSAFDEEMHKFLNILKKQGLGQHRIKVFWYCVT